MATGAGEGGGMKYLKMMAPTAILFLMPWTQKLIYCNILLAWPSCDHGEAQFMAFFGACVCILVTTGLLAAEVER
jgi:hypothetical protein